MTPLVSSSVSSTSIAYKLSQGQAISRRERGKGRAICLPRSYFLCTVVLVYTIICQLRRFETEQIVLCCMTTVSRGSFGLGGIRRRSHRPTSTRSICCFTRAHLQSHMYCRSRMIAVVSGCCLDYPTKEVLTL
jgi:hypothetical protein